MKITIKSNDYGMGFYGDDKPLFWHKDGNCVISLLEQVVNLGATSVEYIGEITDAEVENEFA
jgi:hypothetical protein